MLVKSIMVIILEVTTQGEVKGQAAKRKDKL